MKKLSTKEWIAVIVGVGVVGFFFVFGQYFINYFKTGIFTMDTQTQPAVPQVGIQDTVVGTGDIAEPGSEVTVNYVGTLMDGTKFDSSIDRNEPFQFMLGAGQVIPGWDQGLVGMRVGGTRVLTIPPELGYGSTTYGPIPGNSTLIFQIQLLKVEQASTTQVQ
jgi:FKBP-type peptidyl-prolyl cis-trans isomerase FkpA